MARSGFLGLKGRKPIAKAEGLEPAPPYEISSPVGPKLSEQRTAWPDPYP